VITGFLGCILPSVAIVIAFLKFPASKCSPHLNHASDIKQSVSQLALPLSVLGISGCGLSLEHHRFSLVVFPLFILEVALFGFMLFRGIWIFKNYGGSTMLLTIIGDK